MEVITKRYHILNQSVSSVVSVNICDSYNVVSKAMDIIDLDVSHLTSGSYMELQEKVGQ